MTHSLHRYRKNELGDSDFIFLCTPAIGVNHEGSKEKLLEILDLVLENSPTNINFYENIGNEYDVDKIRKSFKDNSRIRCCFSDYESIRSLLMSLKTGDYGISICVSGPLQQLKRLSEEVDLQLHSVNLSCGYFGDQDKLPADDVLEVSSMCGHGLISAGLVDSLFNKVARDEIDYTEALDTINSQCICGLVNKDRLKHVLVNRQLV